MHRLARRALALATLGALAAIAPAIHAAPGDLDFSFNDQLRLVQRLEADTLHVPRAIVFFLDTNKSLVAGRIGADGASRAFVTRYDIRGVPEQPGAHDVIAHLSDVVDMVRGADGEAYILATPAANDPAVPAVLVRLNRAGRPDTRFAVNGALPIAVDAPSQTVKITALASLPDGSFAIGGVATSTNSIPAVTRAWVARLDPREGARALQPVFVPDYQAGSSRQFVARALAKIVATADGRVIVAANGDLRTSSSDRNGGAVATRIDLASGRVDPTFGAVGRIEWPAETVNDLLALNNLSSGDKLVVLGDRNAALGTPRPTVISMWTSDGQPVRTFGDQGTVVRSIAGESAVFQRLTPSYGNHIHIVGNTYSVPQGKQKYTTTIERYLADGSRDLAFGANGRIDLDLDHRNEWVGAAGEFPSGIRSLVVAVSGDNALALARVTNDDSPRAPMSLVNGASFGNRFAAGAIATAFYPTMQIPAGCRLKQTFATCDLLRTSVVYRSASGAKTAVVKPSYISATQMNVVLPSDILPGSAATVMIENTQDRYIAAADTIYADSVGPGLFTANASGAGTPAGSVVRVTQGGQTESAIGSGPIDLAGANAVYLVLYGTGWRNATQVKVGFKSTAVHPATAPVYGEVTYTGAQPDYAGLDQINVRIPAAELRARGWRGVHELQLEVVGAETRGVALRSQPVTVDLQP